jgi:MtN3 and saliva related transmembrane protein
VFVDQVLGFGAAVIGSFAFLPQVIKAWRSRSTGDVSLWMILAITTAAVLWIVYGGRIGSWPLIVGNGISLTLSLSLLVLKFHCDRQGRQRDIENPRVHSTGRAHMTN